MKDNLIIFEEVVPFEELTDREKQAYERGVYDADNSFTFMDIVKAIIFLLLGVAVGAVLFKYYPELLK